jgi:hypothetical protein
MATIAEGYRGIGMSKFYVIEPADGKMFGTKWTYADLLPPINTGNSEKCPVCGGAVSQRRWLPPFRVKLSSAKPNKWGDFVWGAGFPLLVSKKFKGIYEQEGLTGIDEFSAEVEIVRMGTLKTGQFSISPPTYYLIHVPWGGANQDDVASGLIHDHPKVKICSFCRNGVTKRKQDRVVIEEGSWNGNDIFKPRNAPVPFAVSERFKKIIENYHLNNIWLIPAEKFAYDEMRPRLWFVHE